MSGSDSSEDEQEKKEQSLRASLKKIQKKSTFEKTSCDFVPEGLLRELVTEKTIKDVLNITNPTPEDDALVVFVKTRALKIFAIIVCAKLKKLKKVMNWFLSKDFDDTELPVTNPDNPFCKRSWYDDLIEHQWKFYAATFSATEYNHDLEESRILPFTSKAGDDGRGSFGVVSRYVVHRNHMVPVRTQY
jgi:hypothetical protein